MGCSALGPLVLFALVGASASLFNDPAESWLVYTRAATVSGTAVTGVRCATVAPGPPAQKTGSAAFWVGLAPPDGSYLLQPIVPKWLGNGWYVFSETFDWHSGRDYQSEYIRVHEGDAILTVIELVGDKTYNSAIHTPSGWHNVTIKVPEDVNLPLSVVYFVLEHQPQSCHELPSDNALNYTNIAVQPPVGPFEAKARIPACGSLAHVWSQTDMGFTWNSNQQ